VQLKQVSYAVIVYCIWEHHSYSLYSSKY